MAATGTSVNMPRTLNVADACAGAGLISRERDGYLAAARRSVAGLFALAPPGARVPGGARTSESAAGRPRTAGTHRVCHAANRVILEVDEVVAKAECQVSAACCGLGGPRSSDRSRGSHVMGPPVVGPGLNDTPQEFGKMGERRHRYPNLSALRPPPLVTVLPER